MICKDIRQALSQMVDSELKQDQALIADQHLKSCRDCSAWFEKIKRADALYAKVEAPISLDGRIMSKIDKEAQARNGSNKIKMFFLGNVVPAMTILVAVVAILGVTLSIIKTGGMGSSTLSGLHSYGDSPDEYSSPVKAKFNEKKGQAPAAISATNQTRKIIRTAILGIEIKKGSAKNKLDSLIELTEHSGGYVVDSNLIAGKQSTKAKATVRVPETGFSKTVKSFSALGAVKTLKQSGKDVSDEYVDMQARLKQLKQAEIAFTRLYSRAGKIPDLIDIQEKISEIQTEAEQLQAHLAKLDEQVNYATVNITLQEEKPTNIVTLSAIWERYKPVETGMSAFVVMMSFMVMGLLTALPLAIFAVVIAIVWNYLKARTFKK